MAEFSRPWSGTVTGDAGPYSDDQWTDVWKTLLAPVIAAQGVFIDQLNDLALGGLAATPITIDTGRAMVNGLWYQNDASVSVAISTPAAGLERIDRIFLRASWAAQTVRITQLEGVAVAVAVPVVATPPALTQNDGVTWDIPLWQVHVTDAGVISIWRDERDFIGQYVPVGVTPARVYLEEEFYMPAKVFSHLDELNSFGITLAGNGGFGPSVLFGTGVGRWHLTGVSAANEVSLRSADMMPDVINAHLLVLARQPNTDAELDRVIGFQDGAVSLTPTNGVFFRADGVGNWFAVTRAGGVETATDTGQALDDVFRTFEIRETGTDVVVFLIDGVVVATHQADIPVATALRLIHSIFDSGAGTAGANDYLYVDYTRMRGDR